MKYFIGYLIGMQLKQYVQSERHKGKVVNNNVHSGRLYIIYMKCVIFYNWILHIYRYRYRKLDATINRYEVV